MKNILLIPLLMLITAAAGYWTCRAAGWNPHLRELELSVAICVIAAMVALLPSVAARSSGMVAVSQSGLLGTIIHMFLTILLAALVWVAKLPQERSPYLFWLLTFYWVSLVALVIGLVRIVRQVAAGQTQAGANLPPRGS